MAWENGAVGLLVLVALAALFTALGRAMGSRLVGAEDASGFRSCIYLAGGLFVTHAVLAWLDLIGLPWHPALLAFSVAGLAWAGSRWIGSPAPAVEKGSRLGWADATACAATCFFALLAASGRISFPDFVYHWGVKGHRYYLAMGVDYDYLSREWNLVTHPDYPQLLPELYALHSLVARGFYEGPLLLWSAVFLAMLLVCVREALRAWRVEEVLAHFSVAIIAMALVMFGVGYLMAGSSDWVIALVLVAVLPALARAPSLTGDLQIGLLAGLAAAAKLEGVALALLLVGAAVWRRLQKGERPSAASFTRWLGPPLLACIPWLLQGARHGLFSDSQSGAFEPSRGPEIAAALWQTMLRSEWHWVPFCLLLVPLLLARAETRIVGGIVALLLAVYVTRYFTATFDYEFSVLSSFPRLMFHVIPTTLVGLTVVLDRWRRTFF